jgi:hypothetical protein
MPEFSAHEHQGCMAVNNISNNRLGVFEILGATGALRWVADVPTGGVGRNGGYVSIPQIVSTAPENGRACIFAANAGTNDISAFEITIEQEPGTPCPCSLKAAGTPAAIGAGAVFGGLGAGLAVTPDGKALYSANPGSSDITRYAVQRGCGIGLAGARVAAPPAPADIQMKPDGRCLAVSSPLTDSVDMYRVGSDYALTPAGRFDVPGPGQASGIEFSSRIARDSLYVTKAAEGRVVVVRFDVGDSCRLAAAPAVSAVPTGRTSSVARLDPENRCLFVPSHTTSRLAVNHPPSVLTAFTVDPLTGALTQPTTVDDVAFYPAGLELARTYEGTPFLYYTSFTREIFRRRAERLRPGPGGAAWRARGAGDEPPGHGSAARAHDHPVVLRADA